MAISFKPVAEFDGITGELPLENPTSLQFGADGRLYVAEQNGSINAFTLVEQDGKYVVTDREELLLGNGTAAISLQNYNDDGILSNVSDRQVTGLLVAGTSDRPVVYVSSSDPRIAYLQDAGLDTNSGVVTRLTWNGVEWSAVDLVRGLPRSEQNHSINGMVLSEDGTKLYLAVGGNTNNGAPSNFFSNTGEYALSGTVLELDLEDLNERPVLTDLQGGQNGTARNYIYDLPTLDDPNVENITDGVGEDAAGLDENGPWGGNDGLNMAILPADAPLRIVADGFRNQFDLVLRADGQLYTVDNGSNADLGGNPVDAEGNPTEEPMAGAATNNPNNGGSGDPEPLFAIAEGNYYGHPVPARANQTLSWTVYDDVGNPDTSLKVNSVDNLADLVPAGVEIAEGFLIDPSKFTGNGDRLRASGIRVEHNSTESNSLVNLGSSSNGLAEYTSSALNGALAGSLIVAQFNGNITLLNLNDEGTAIEPLVDPSENNAVVDEDGIFPLITGRSTPLDVTTGPNGTIWITELGDNKISGFAPSVNVAIDNLDFDGDGILNPDDPFLRDRTNGGLVEVTPGSTLLWDFDANQDGNLPGANGYGGGLTGVMSDGTTDYEVFFQEPSDLTGQIVKLDNVKFNTAAGGGTTVIESVGNGDAFETQNDGEYLFHTGVTVQPTVDTFKIKWSVFNPGADFIGSFQQIGGYIGTGDQSNYLKIVAIAGAEETIQILLEDDDVVVAESYIPAEDLFVYSSDRQIFLELEIDPNTGTATPTVSYETDEGMSTVMGTAIDLGGTAVLDAIRGNYQVNDLVSGLAVGLYSSNTNQSQADTFQAVFDDLEITATGNPVTPTVLYRVNAGGELIPAIDGNLEWSADTEANNSVYLVEPGSNSVVGYPLVEPGVDVPVTVPNEIFNTERWSSPDGIGMAWAFDVPTDGLYEVRLYAGNGFDDASEPGERLFDVAVENNVPAEFDNIDLSDRFGHEVGGLLTSTTEVTDGTLNLEFIQGVVENPMINGIEILQLNETTLNDLSVEIVGGAKTVSENQGRVQISFLTNKLVPIDETVEAIVTIEPITATATEDYSYSSPTAVYDPDTGIYTEQITIAGGSADATIAIDLISDAIAEDETFSVSVSTLDSKGNITAIDSTAVTIAEESNSSVLYRVNTGGEAIAATDSEIAWSADTEANNSLYLDDPGSNSLTSFPAVTPGETVANNVPDEIFATERWDLSTGTAMQWGFEVEDGLYQVRLYLGNGFADTSAAGERVFDVAVEDNIPAEFDNIDPSALFGHEVGGMISSNVEVTDGILNLEFLHGAAENPMINGIEILQLDETIV